MNISAGKQRLSLSQSDGPDPHGKLALMLCESLFHVLVEQGMVSQEKAMEAIDGVVDLMYEAADCDLHAVNNDAALMLVEALRDSFAVKDPSRR